MVEQLLIHINRFALCKTTDKILLAVSGGLDSMVMLDLMHRAGFDLAVAHVNFQLRATESLADEGHVREACLKYNVPFFSTRVDTMAFSAEKGISVQMAARDLRYAYFENLLQSHGYDYVATAHHLNDSIETIFLNLVRGTGLQGIRGIPGKNGKIIRPLLFATRKMLTDYAIGHGLRWREDSSNFSDDYQRNFFRHQVVPKFEELNPSFEETFRDTQERLMGAADINQVFIKGFCDSAVRVKGDTQWIDIPKIRESPAPAIILWELIKSFGFNFDQCRQICLNHQAGKLFYSDTHQLVIDREDYIVTKKQDAFFSFVLIDTGQRIVGSARSTLMFTEKLSADFQMIKDSTIAQVDADLLQFPLTWRNWQAGDYFMPLGMHQEKKLSDFLIDLKMPFNKKADVTVLESAGKIVWVVGYRINERYKVTEKTKRVLIIEEVAS